MIKFIYTESSVRTHLIIIVMCLKIAENLYDCIVRFGLVYTSTMNTLICRAYLVDALDLFVAVKLSAYFYHLSVSSLCWVFSLPLCIFQVVLEVIAYG